MEIGNFRGQVHCLEKFEGDPIRKKARQEKLKVEFKKFENEMSIDEINWIKRVLYDEEVYLKQHSINDFINTVMNRRSLRMFGEALNKEDISLICQSGGLAPSSCNRQPLEIIVIEDRIKIFNIAKAKKQNFISGAKTLIIPLADKNVYPKPNNANINSFYYFLYSDMAAAVQNMLLAAENLKIAMCWVNLSTIKERNHIKEKLLLPDNLFPFCLLPCGYKLSGTETARPGRKDIKIHLNKYYGG